MHIPSREAFAELAEPGRLVPVYRQLMGDLLTPVLALDRLQETDYAFLLESVTGGEKIGRYSFLGVDPAVIFRSRGTTAEIVDGRTGAVQKEETPSSLDALRDLLADYQAVHLPELPRFVGGAVGYFAYDVVRQAEDLPGRPARSLGLPEIYMGVYDSMLIFDHVNKTCKVVVHADCREQSPGAAYAQACERIDAIVERLSAPSGLALEDVPPIPEALPAVDSNFTKEAYMDVVERCKEYIRAGDIFQVVPSQRLSAPCTAPPFEVYRNIRVINPSPYMFYLKYPELALVGSSPEVMVRVEDGVITVRPIAGTRRRGADEAEDRALAADLLGDPKERAEHTMLLDLGRNDVGRVSRYGSVEITEEMVVEYYSHVMHIVSNVEGRLRDGLTAFDTFRACLPAGTVSGAPKVRAMEIIDEMEPDERGPYAGAVGYVDFSGNLDTCITIRTVLLHDGTAYVQAGGGVVADSVPENEYVETQNKAKALLRAIQVSQGG